MLQLRFTCLLSLPQYGLLTAEWSPEILQNADAVLSDRRDWADINTVVLQNTAVKIINELPDFTGTYRPRMADPSLCGHAPCETRIPRLPCMIAGPGRSARRGEPRVSPSTSGNDRFQKVYPLIAR